MQVVFGKCPCTYQSLGWTIGRSGRPIGWNECTRGLWFAHLQVDQCQSKPEGWTLWIFNQCVFCPNFAIFQFLAVKAFEDACLMFPGEIYYLSWQWGSGQNLPQFIKFSQPLVTWYENIFYTYMFRFSFFQLFKLGNNNLRLVKKNGKLPEVLQFFIVRFSK